LNTGVFNNPVDAVEKKNRHRIIKTYKLRRKNSYAEELDFAKHAG